MGGPSNRRTSSSSEDPLALKDSEEEPQASEDVNFHTVGRKANGGDGYTREEVSLRHVAISSPTSRTTSSGECGTENALLDLKLSNGSGRLITRLDTAEPRRLSSGGGSLRRLSRAATSLITVFTCWSKGEVRLVPRLEGA